jgi:hypothetical protein
VTDYAGSFWSLGHPISAFAQGGNVVGVDRMAAVEVTPDPPSPPPSVTWVTAPGTPLASTDPLIFTVSDESFAALVISASFQGAGVDEVVYRYGSGFTSRYAARSSVDSSEAEGVTTLTFSIARREGWLAGVTIHVDVVDSEGQID